MSNGTSKRTPRSDGMHMCTTDTPEAHLAWTVSHLAHLIAEFGQLGVEFADLDLDRIDPEVGRRDHIRQRGFRFGRGRAKDAVHGVLSFGKNGCQRGDANPRVCSVAESDPPGARPTVQACSAQRHPVPHRPAPFEARTLDLPSTRTSTPSLTPRLPCPVGARDERAGRLTWRSGARAQFH